MKQLFLVILFFYCISVFSQKLEGYVFDQNKNPLSSVSVYLDGTTFGTSTDNDGKYIIYTNSKINTNLVFRFIGYETFYLSNPFQNNNPKIILIEKQEALEEVVIKSKETLSRKQKLEIFKSVFLGNTKGGLSSKIRNEDDIKFRFNKKKNSLFATCKNPLVVENDFLQYDIFFDLYNFEAELMKSEKDEVLTFNHNGIIRTVKSIYLGTTVFKDFHKNEKIIKLRNQAYRGSSKHFFKNIANNFWGNDAFLLFKNGFQTNANFHFKIEDEGDNKKITILKNQISEIPFEERTTPFYASFNVLYDKKEQSKIIFLSDVFYIDKYGNISDLDKIVFSGLMATKKVGDMLPLDFIPAQD